MKYLTLLLLFILISCNTPKNDTNNSKILLEKYQKRIKSQNEEIQRLMTELSSCKKDSHIDENRFGEIKISLNKKTDIYFNHKFLSNSDTLYLDEININDTNIIKFNREKLPPRILEIKSCNWQKDDNGYFYKQDLYLETGFSKTENRDIENIKNIEKHPKNNESENIQNKEIVPKDKFIAISKHISGGCFKSDITRVIHNSKHYLERCIKKPIRGKLLLNWEISPEGVVSWVNIKGNSVGDKKVVNCFISIIKTGRYNSNSNICNIKYQFEF